MSPGEDHFRRLERMYLTAPINDFFQPQMVVSAGRAEITMEAGEHLHHAAGAVHGAAYFKMLDDAAWFAVASLFEDVFVLTVDFSVNLVRPFSRGKVTAVGRVAHRGIGILVGESELVDGRGRKLGLGRGSFVKGQKKLGPEVGYA